MQPLYNVPFSRFAKGRPRIEHLVQLHQHFIGRMNQSSMQDGNLHLQPSANRRLMDDINFPQLFELFAVLMNLVLDIALHRYKLRTG
jgi:hypothetical protein